MKFIQLVNTDQYPPSDPYLLLPWASRERLKMYRNPDPRCTYPFEMCSLGYCWSYAHHVDGTTGYEDMMLVCPTCDCWKD